MAAHHAAVYMYFGWLHCNWFPSHIDMHQACAVLYRFVKFVNTKKKSACACAACLIYEVWFWRANYGPRMSVTVAESDGKQNLSWLNWSAACIVLTGLEPCDQSHATERWFSFTCLKERSKSDLQIMKSMWQSARKLWKRVYIATDGRQPRSSKYSYKQGRRAVRWNGFDTRMHWSCVRNLTSCDAEFQSFLMQMHRALTACGLVILAAIVFDDNR